MNLLNLLHQGRAALYYRSLGEVKKEWVFVEFMRSQLSWVKAGGELVGIRQMCDTVFRISRHSKKGIFYLCQKAVCPDAKTVCSDKLHVWPCQWWVKPFKKLWLLINPSSLWGLILSCFSSLISTTPLSVLLPSIWFPASMLLLMLLPLFEIPFLLLFPTVWA